ncbi:hypothetical protein A2755_01940 [Candidatus Wolfebacteria bacterium RIFCSPHIGHO2_01_FULL_48_22]|uniref:Antitoxin n=2 Tax=Candidatus Wolfeibacteriota TaxID=1752735 RepID=A0A1F8DR75_9BACT|nr:MAG: hypothetical protein A2755_01940 [Candidatus Wolfebacteria bacterium RIFCSPHIGHO2_01_FULL_48_22]OGM91993.1 MAG: hypothetical protein A2935_02580 [Candidatus Wolfebacteria bacterium RIFCSPLOWO2_01_FULL_47_17b]
MTIFSKIKKTLESEDACVISKEGIPLYTVVTYEKYQQLMDKLKKMDEIQKELEEEVKEGEYDIDINKIPL